MRRSAGILMPISALPSRYGIGTLGEAAYEFIDFLEAAGQSYWQILPIGPTGYGDSPYQSFSAFAGNPYFIDLDLLARDGWLKKEEYSEIHWGDDPGRTDYGTLYKRRFDVLRKAVKRLLADVPDDYCIPADEFPGNSCRTAFRFLQYLLDLWSHLFFRRSRGTDLLTFRPAVFQAPE